MAASAHKDYIVFGVADDLVGHRPKVQVLGLAEVSSCVSYEDQVRWAFCEVIQMLSNQVFCLSAVVANRVDC